MAHLSLIQQLKVSVVFVTLASVASAQECIVVPFSQPAADVQVYVYHGRVTLKMAWSDNYKNPEDAAYKELYNNIYSELFQTFSCKLPETKEIFIGLINIIFSEGSVKVDWDLVLNQSYPDGELLSEKATRELRKTTAFKDVIIDTQIIDKMTLAFTTIGAVTGIISLLSMLYGIYKRMKKLIVKAKNGEGSSTMVGLTNNKTATKSETPSPDTNQEAEVTPQGYVMPQAYIIQDNHVSQVASTAQYNAQGAAGQGQGFVLSMNQPMIGTSPVTQVLS